MIRKPGPVRRATGLLLTIVMIAATTLTAASVMGIGTGYTAPSAPAWERQALPEHGPALLGISGTMDTFSRAGWSVGESGTILRTEDGGATWHSQASGVNQALRGVASVNASAAWAVGDSGTVLSTLDGKTWEKQDSGTGEDLYAVAVLDATHVWAVGTSGTILFFDGTAWAKQPSGTSNSLRGISSADAGRIWAVGDEGTILFSNGKGWAAQVSGTDQDLRSVSAAKATSRAWACGDAGTIAATSDGVVWGLQASPTRQDLNGVAAFDSRTVYVAGSGGVILQTTNGTAWTLQESTNRNPLQAIETLPGNRVWAAGGGRIETTEDGGTTWAVRHQEEALTRIACVDAVDAYRAWLVGDGGSILHTEDAGATWLRQASGTDICLNRVAAAGEDIAWAIGEGGIILNTVDGGATWIRQYDDGHTSFRGLGVAGALTAWAVGEGGAIKKTEDGGRQWMDQASGTGEDLCSVIALDAGTAWAAGRDGTMLFTVDGGAHWTPQTTGTTVSLNAIAAADAFTLWAVGENGTVLSTKDGGLTWLTQGSGVTVSLRDVAAIDEHTAWAAGDRGVVLKTGDGGGTWAKEDSTTRSGLKTLGVVDGDIAWVAGEGITLLRTAGWVRYFAEGHTGDGFQEFLSLFNPGRSSAAVSINFRFAGGEAQVKQVSLPGESRTTIDVNGAVGLGRDVSLVMRADREIQAERPVYFNYGGGWSGGADTFGSPGPSVVWNFAEGYTGPGFDQYVCVLNPCGRPAAVMFDFQTEENGPISLAGYIVPAGARATFRVNDLLGGVYRNSLELKSTVPVVAERSMYFDYGGAQGGNRWTGGHTVVGAPVLAHQYLFAEGTTRNGFDEYLALQNPGATPLQVNAVFEPVAGLGAPITRVFEVGAGKRGTVSVRDVVGPDMDVSVKVSAASPFLAERAIYFDYLGYGAGWTGGSCVIGATAVSTEWLFAEGVTGDAWHEYLCLQNPNSVDATVQVTYFSQERGVLTPTGFVLPANGRATIVVNTQAGRDLRLAARVFVTSGPGIIAERSEYFDFGGWTGGCSVMGANPTR